MTQLGGAAVPLATDELQLGRGETVRDTALVLSRYLDAVVVRTYRQSDLEELARHASIPVVNGLTDEFHPCQALADALTLRERFDDLERVRVAYVGDGNNVCHSLMTICAKLGIDFVASTPRVRAARRRRRRGAGGRRSSRRDGRLRPRAPRGRHVGACPVYRRVDEHGPGRRGRAAPAGVRGLSDRRGAARARRPTGDRHARSAGALREEIGEDLLHGRARPRGIRRRTACTRRKPCSRSSWPEGHGAVEARPARRARPPGRSRARA